MVENQIGMESTGCLYVTNVNGGALNLCIVKGYYVVPASKYHYTNDKEGLPKQILHDAVLAHHTSNGNR